MSNSALISAINRLADYHIYGTISGISGLTLYAKGIGNHVVIGSKCMIESRNNNMMPAEVVGFNDDLTILMPFTHLEGVGIGCKIWVNQEHMSISPDLSWKGRVLNAMGEPLDGKILPQGNTAYSLKNTPPPAHLRKRLGAKIDTGVRALDSFIPCCSGQRMGIFAGSGVGKSQLIAMLADFAKTDVKVIGLIGERGRELQEFLQDTLGEEGLKSTVIVVATSDESALMRRQAAYVTMSIAEYFRDQGQEVLLMIDSITRFAMAQREIGLASGEPPTSKGYTPTVFSELPQLLERAGPGIDKGMITGLFSVLVEGDDHNEPIADAVRSILDGHIVLDRAIAEKGRYPAINILKSVSRALPKCNNDQENLILLRAKQLLSTYYDLEEMITLGAYKKGSDPKVDEAIFYLPLLEQFLTQHVTEYTHLEESMTALTTILEQKPTDTS